MAIECAIRKWSNKWQNDVFKKNQYFQIFECSDLIYSSKYILRLLPEFNCHET